MTPISDKSIISNDRLNNSQAATYLGVAPDTLVTWRCTKRVVIPYIKLGGKVFYRKNDLDEFLESCLVSH